MPAPSPFAAAVRALRADRVLLLVVCVCIPVDILVALFDSQEDSVIQGPVSHVASWTLTLAACAMLAARHRWPVAAGVLTLLIAGAYFPLSSVDGSVPISAFIVCLYGLARSGQLTAALTLTVVSMLALGYTELVHFGSGERHIDAASVILLGGWLLSVIAFGHAMQVRAAYQHEAEQRALAAERERDARARSAATEERLRIARELHDVLGHNISLISVQAAAALHRSAKRPGETAELLQALTFVRDTSKEALRELRATLGVLRQVDEEPPTAPAAGLDRLGELADRARATGLDVTVEVTGEPVALPPQVSLAAYRIVQESLTNVTRHAPGATRADVTVAYGPGELCLTVEDDGRAGRSGAGGGDVADTATDGAGSGIGGMRERARALGGHLTAAPTPTGYRVHARLPLPE
ncbi:sensor histidine kinase [Streptomyces sp. 7-21]|jgi:signal transduction histidine kinase|uniref:sensor histidine kinase n=1 Tax=Streptomyces sp. 7-21 TaxID=2802283 RepID=UPI001F4281BA|nr:sensor histidine kinase [Streptomyces sp. 7-21]